MGHLVRVRANVAIVAIAQQLGEGKTGKKNERPERCSELYETTGRSEPTGQESIEHHREQRDKHHVGPEERRERNPKETEDGGVERRRQGAVKVGDVSIE